MSMRTVAATVMKDISTTSSGDYDIARVAGYGVTVLGAVVFLGLSIYDTWANQKFNYEGFSLALTAISIAITGAAAGVWIKKGAERPGEDIQKIKLGATPQDESDTTTQVPPNQ